MTLTWRSKILLAKLETTYGTDAEPTGAADAVQAIDIQLTPMEGTDVSRDLELPWMGAQGTLAGELRQVLSFKVELEPSGEAGTPPAWGPLLRACACAETISADTSVTYNPVSEGHESVSIFMQIAGTRHVLLGARGTCVMELNAQGIPYLNFTFTGLWTEPSEETRPTPTLTGWKKPKLATSANTPVFTLAGAARVMRSFSLNLGNQVEPRFLINSDKVVITDRADMIETTIEAVPLTTFNPYALAQAGTPIAVTLTHGTTAGAIATLNAPAAEMQRPQGLENAQGIVEWPLRLMPLPAAGNDQWTLVLT